MFFPSFSNPTRLSKNPNPKKFILKVSSYNNTMLRDAFFAFRDFFDSFNGLRYLRVGGRGFCLGSRKNSKRGKCSKMPQNPTRQVHALLGCVFQRLYFFSIRSIVLWIYLVAAGLAFLIAFFRSFSATSPKITIRFDKEVLISSSVTLSSLII